MKNVWCTPNQDMQSRIKLARLTGFGGAWNDFRVLRRKISLPVPNLRFHVYQIGGLHPLLMGLLESDRVWTSMADTCNAVNMIADIYVQTGVQLMRSQVWYMVTPEKDLILAVQIPSKIPVDLNQDDLFLRVYRNAYFGSGRSDALNDYVKVISGIPLNIQDILNLQKQFTTLGQLPGYVYAFVNGVKVSSVDMLSVKVEDNVEIIYDSSIMKVIDFPLPELPSFVSTLDGKHKYLLHYPGNGDMAIDFDDDIDVFVHKAGVNGRYTGLYYHYNAEDAIRMVTHKDYAVPVPYVQAYLGGPIGADRPEDLTLRLHIRKSGYLRPLVKENNRIHELYKLADDKLIEAMVGLNAVVPNWTAANLENSAYATIMRSDIIDVTKQVVEDAYGYNAISQLLGNTPSQVTTINGNNAVKVPHGLFAESTAYEYDADGLLLGWNPHTNGTVYFSYASRAALVEQVVGLGDNYLDDTYGAMTQVLDPALEYRMYICAMANGAPTNKWLDVTDSHQYAVINNKLTWLIDPSINYTLVRSNKRFLGYDLKLPVTAGVLKFDLDEYQTRAGIKNLYVSQVPQGEYDFWLNGNSLIEGIDYIFNFPEVCIISKRYFVNPETDLQHLTVRGMGFCNSDMTHQKAEDTGFIEYGLLSHNNRFDIRDDKVVRIVVGGKTMARSMLQFSEEDAAVAVPNAKNGLPYMVRDIVVPLRGNAVTNTYLLRSEALAIDKVIADYMTQTMPEPVQPGPNTIESLYEVYTPFLAKIIHDLRAKNLNDPRMTTDYSDNDVMDICKPYEYLLPFDPTQLVNNPNPDYVTIHPHELYTPLDVNLFQYRFILRVINIYMPNAGIVTSRFLTLST